MWRRLNEIATQLIADGGRWRWPSIRPAREPHVAVNVLVRDHGRSIGVESEHLYNASAHSIGARVGLAWLRSNRGSVDKCRRDALQHAREMALVEKASAMNQRGRQIAKL
jgi:hypothetical protein